MTTSASRAPPLSERQDGLVTIKCPFCHWPWYRMEPAEHPNLHEIKCGRCKRFVRYHIDGERVITLTA
jgi:phage FluMu protein Com